MARLDINALLAMLRTMGTDTYHIEVKDASRGMPSSIDETLSAFGNMPEGGIIVLGVAEGDGDFPVTGVWNVREAQAGLAAKAREAIVPPLQLGAIQNWKVSGKDIVTCIVPPQPKDRRPFRDGKYGRSFIRSGDGDYVLSQLEEQYLVGSRSQPDADIQAVDAADVERDLVPELVEHYLAVQRERSYRLRQLTREEQLIRTNVVDPQTGKPTVAAVLAMGIYPQQFFPFYTVKAHVTPRQGEEGVRLKSAAEFTGPIADMMEGALSWVKRNVNTDIVFRDGDGFNEEEIPAVVFRELIVNALVHRDLSVASSGAFVHLIKTGDHFIVKSPGGLWGLNVMQLGMTAPRARNSALYQMCASLNGSDGQRLIEGYGTGIPAVQRTLREAGLPAAFFHDEVVSFSATVTAVPRLDVQEQEWLESLPGFAELGPAQKYALIALRRGEKLSLHTYQHRFPMVAEVAMGELDRLVDFGLIVPAGKYFELTAGDDPLTRISASDHGGYLSQEEKRAHITQALRVARRPLSKRELVTATGMSVAQVTGGISDLVAAGIIAPTESNPRSRNQKYWLA